MIGSALIGIGIAAAERGWVPEPLMRAAIRRLCGQRLADERHAFPDPAASVAALIKAMAGRAIAPAPVEANRQHYEVPAEFFRLVLGPHLKYSACWFDGPEATLADAEEAALRLAAEHAGIGDGMAILELGSGWGSLALWLAARYPNASITGLSNSHSQREFIHAEATRRGLDNVRIVTGNVEAFDPGTTFDRIVSVEMFEHLFNWPLLLSRVDRWLRDDGRFFAHVFCHRDRAYTFTDRGAADWMAREFFTGGIMPSADLFARCASGLVPEKHWLQDGTHYARTAEAWLANLDRHRDAVLRIFRTTHGAGAARRWFHRWRMFFLACAELFAFAHGTEWMVVHHRLAKQPSAMLVD